MIGSENGQVTRKYAFGPFVVDEVRRMLLRDGETVPLTPKAFEILLVLIERRGQVLEKEELIERIWPDTAVEENNLARNVSALRKALGENPDEHQYIVTVPGRGYRFVASVQEVTAESWPLNGQKQDGLLNPPNSVAEVENHASEVTTGTEPASNTEQPSHKSKRQRIFIVWLVALIWIGLIAGVVSLMRARFQNSPSRVQRPLMRLTFDPGLQGEPTWSPDGRFVAYSSDQNGNSDIWVRQVGRGNPVQVTHSPANDWQPSWSPDGSKIVFRSERGEGGLFVVPALGGPETKVSAFGHRPRWSPDGSQILFYGSSLPSADVPPKIYVLRLDDSPPREVLADVLAQFTNLRSVVWHPDGQRISFLAFHRQLGAGFWTVPLSGSSPIRSEFSPQAQQQTSVFPIEGSDHFLWAPSGRVLYIEAISQGIKNIWKVEVDPQTLNIVGGVERLTTGPGIDMELAISPDGKRLAFTTRSEQTRLWSLPLNAGRLQGEAAALTPAELTAAYPDLSRDGQKLAFILTRSGKPELWEKWLKDGHETLLAGPDDYRRSTPRWSFDGSRLAYHRARFTNAERGQSEFSIVWLSAEGGEEQIITSPSAFAEQVSDWSADGKWIIASSERPSPGRRAICLFPIAAAPKAETQMRVMASNPEFTLSQPRFSPNGRWLCFSAVKINDNGISTLYVMPAAGGDWVRLTEGRAWDDKACWAPDGKTLYFLSNRTGLLNVWGLRFDPNRGQPVGEPFRITSFDHTSRRISRQLSSLALSLSPERLILPIIESTGAVWILENVDR